MISTVFLAPHEYHLYEGWLKQQDPETLKLYFGVVVADGFVEQLVKRVTANPEKHHFLVAIDKGQWIGVVHIADTPGQGAEFGFIVDPAYRGRGIADKLMDEATTWCRNRRYQRLFLHCLSWNEPIKKLCIKHGLNIHNQQGDAEVNVKLPSPSIFTIGKEITSTQRNMFTMLLDRSMHPNREQL